MAILYAMSFSTKQYQDDLARQLRGYARHTLEEYGGEPARVFVLRPPGGGHMESTTIAFFGGCGGKVAPYIAILGDACPRLHGVISSYGYGVGWFSGRLSDEYLCSKFLDRVWVPELALASLRNALDSEREDIGGEGDDARTLKRLDALQEAIEDAEDDASGLVVASPDRFHETWNDIFEDSPEDRGYGYAPLDAARLVAIQATFARLYGERETGT